MTELERKHLVETDRHIAECKAHIATQREFIERAIQQGRSTEVTETTLGALETSLRLFERQRQLLLDRLQERERGPPPARNRIMIYGPKTDRILAGVLTVASGAWIILILLGYLESLGWGHVLGLFVLFGIGVASLLTGKRRT